MTYGRYKIIPIREEIIRFCESIGFDYMGAIIWQKKTTMNTTGGASVMGSFPYLAMDLLRLITNLYCYSKVRQSPNQVSKEIKEESKLSNEEWRNIYRHWNFAGCNKINICYVPR